MKIWLALAPGVTEEHLGLLPDFIDDACPDSAVVQFNRNYAHGGGWFPMQGFELHNDLTLKYPGDPPLKPLAGTTLRHETIVLYEREFVAVIQPDGSFEVTRMD